GRFISVDPIMDLTDAQQMHGYTYSNNNPLTFSDPSGMQYCGNVMACDPDPTYCGNVMACPGDGEQTTTSPTAPGGTAHCDNYCMAPPKKPASHTGQGKGNQNPLSKAWGWTKKKTSQAVHYTQDNWKKVAPIVVGGLAEWGCMAAATSAGAATAGASAVGGAMLCGALGNSIYSALDDQLNHGDRSSTESLVKIAQDAGVGALTGGAAQGVINKFARVCHSFVPGTGILMADGTTKAIQDVQPGDVVLATDPETGESKPRTVLASITTEDDKEFADITVETDDGDASIIATTNHPFWIPDLKQWIDAGDLKQGQWLQASTGVWVQVGSIRHFRVQQRTHDLTTDEDHTYHVLAGTTPVLVHNCGGLMPGHSELCTCNGIGDDIILKDVPKAYSEADEGAENVVRRDVHGVLAAGDDGMTESDIQHLVTSADQVFWQGSGSNLARVYLRRASDGTYDAAVRRFADGGPITSFRNLTESSLQGRLKNGRWYDPNG
ncbi:polymorphic toxin-type HINT domain-containing protein, partial [Embleya sp. NPDC050493]|uniref:polymorphic toxin-type HINT domain-containing protein n=1 Tax=Embleya sp. NPDC050493 TaxID=3363989 RepID=UPI00379E48A4